MSDDFVLDALVKARKLIEKRRRWTRYTTARTRLGVRVDSANPSARTFCAIGAVRRVSIDLDRDVVDFYILPLLNDAATELYRQEGGPRVQTSDVNDGLRCGAHKRVLRVFDKAIADRKAEGWR